MIEKVSEYLIQYKDVVEGTAKAINEFGSITGDDIKKIFVDLNRESEIQTVDVKTIYENIILMNN